MEGNGKNFDEQVKATSFAGSVLERLDRIETMQTDMAKDVREVRDFVKPAAFFIGAIPTVISALAFLKSLGVF
jgi:uncharacterized protein (UPF0335 family)